MVFEERGAVLDTLQSFAYERTLNDDPAAHTLALLGTLPTADGARAAAIVRVERATLDAGALIARWPAGLLRDTRLMERNDIYSWMLAWLSPSEDAPDLKISVICPATEVHIKKYSKQEVLMVHETPELYERIVQPYIAAFPPARTQWVEDILAGASEADKVLHSTAAFVLLPDMKWDGRAAGALYLLALARAPRLRSLRDLRRARDLPLLRDIRTAARRVAKERWGLQPDALRMFVHYQPSYYRFHVHIVNANVVGTMGSAVGQSHLLDDLISLLELDPEDGPSILERMTLTYGLGEQHGLYAALKAAQDEDM